MATFLESSDRLLVRVFMLENSSKVLLADSCSTAEDVCFAMAEKLDFENAEDLAMLFALYDCVDGAKMTRCIEPEEILQAVINEWEEPSRHQLVFMIKLFVDDLLQSVDDRVIYMQYIQAVYMVITGQYPCPVESCIRLAALQLRHTFGPAPRTSGFLGDRILEFVPFNLLEDEKAASQWEGRIYTAHDQLGPEVNAQQARLWYLEVVEAWECYGCSFFPVNQEGVTSATGERLPRKLVLGICARGLRLFSREPGIPVEERGVCLLQINIYDMYKWGFTDNEAFYLDVRTNRESEFTSQLYFSTRRGQQIAALLSEYAMELLHHREAEEKQDLGPILAASRRGPMSTFSEDSALLSPNPMRQTQRSTGSRTRDVRTSSSSVAEEPSADPPARRTVLGAFGATGTSTVDASEIDEAPATVVPRVRRKSRRPSGTSFPEEKDCTTGEGPPHPSSQGPCTVARSPSDQYAAAVKGVIALQARWRGAAVRRRWNNQEAVVCIQLCTRRFLGRVRRVKMIQAAYRGYRVRKAFLEKSVEKAQTEIADGVSEAVERVDASSLLGR